jgi:two-component system LytT family response regulator
MAKDVEWIETDKNYALFYLQNTNAQETVHLLRETIVELKEKLNPEQFVRVHRSAIVCISYIASIQKRTERNYDVFLHDGTR